MMSESDDVDIKTTGSGDNVDKSEHNDNTQQGRHALKVVSVK